MTPDEAYETLVKRMTGDGADPIARAAWQALDDALKGDADLPEPWLRLTGTSAATRAGRDPQQWANLVSQGYAPPPDGRDDVGRAWWHPATADAFKAHGWTRPRAPGTPPAFNASREKWIQFALECGGVTYPHQRRDQIIALCRENGWLS
jgi:hypothetical protein